jgi:hypothetical protein
MVQLGQQITSCLVNYQRAFVVFILVSIGSDSTHIGGVVIALALIVAVLHGAKVAKVVYLFRTKATFLKL